METIEALNIALDNDLTKAAKILVNKSAEFIYSCDKLTKKQKSDIIAINANYEAMAKRHAEAREYRWKNYYDCVDDYSVCGVMDQAENWEAGVMLRKNTVLIESVLRGGYFIHVSKCLTLRELATNKLFYGVNHGKYGDYFTVGEGKFISKAKKVDTYLKKGYQPEVRSRVYRCVFDHMSPKGNIVCKTIDLLEEKMHVINNDIEVVIPEDIPTNFDFIDYCYRDTTK